MRHLQAFVKVVDNHSVDTFIDWRIHVFGACIQARFDTCSNDRRIEDEH